MIEIEPVCYSASMRSDRLAKVESLVILALMAAVVLAIDRWPARKAVVPGPESSTDILLPPADTTPVAARDTVPRLSETLAPVHEARARRPVSVADQAPAESLVPIAPDDRNPVEAAALVLLPVSLRGVPAQIAVTLPAPTPSTAAQSVDDEDWGNAVARGFQATGGALRIAFKKTGAGLSVLGKAF